MIQCPGCGGTNPQDALSCEWCRRSFVRSYRRGLSARWWGTLSGAIIGVLLVLVLGLGVLNAVRSSAPRADPAPTASPPPLLPLAIPSPSPVTAQIANAGGATATPSQSPTPDVAPATRYARVTNTGGRGANLRREPATSSAQLAAVAEGAVVQLLGPEQRSADGLLWRQVDDGRGTTGWIVADALVETTAPR